VLVLSEFAGLAQQYLSGAIRISTVLTLSRVERELRHSKLYR